MHRASKKNNTEHGAIMKSGYESLVWLKDKSGKEYVCYSDDMSDKKSFDQLNKDEKNHCADVNQMVGTERW